MDIHHFGVKKANKLFSLEKYKTCTLGGDSEYYRLTGERILLSNSVTAFLSKDHTGLAQTATYTYNYGCSDNRGVQDCPPRLGSSPASINSVTSHGCT